MSQGCLFWQDVPATFFSDCLKNPRIGGLDCGWVSHIRQDNHRYHQHSLVRNAWHWSFWRALPFLSYPDTRKMIPLIRYKAFGLRTIGVASCILGRGWYPLQGLPHSSGTYISLILRHRLWSSIQQRHPTIKGWTQWMRQNPYPLFFTCAFLWRSDRNLLIISTMSSFLDFAAPFLTRPSIAKVYFSGNRRTKERTFSWGS